MRFQPSTSLFFSFLALLACTKKKEKTGPNVTLIMADDLGHNDLSCYRTTGPEPAHRPPTAHFCKWQ